jgi:FtsH-binding integral membrane protein
MSYDPYRASDPFAPSSSAAPVDAGLQAYMQRVYSYMAGGLALTGIVAYAAASSGFYQSFAATPMIWVIMLAPLGFVLALTCRIHIRDRGTSPQAQATNMVPGWRRFGCLSSCALVRRRHA